MVSLYKKSRGGTEMLFAALDLRVTTIEAQGNFSVLLPFFSSAAFQTTVSSSRQHWYVSIPTDDELQ